MAGYENLGPGVSQNPQAVSPGGGNFSADERSYDSLVFQQNCPPMDWEMNLSQSVVGNAGLRNALSSLVISSFISGDFLESVGPGNSYTFFPAAPGNENKFGLAACNLVVNGWNVRFEYSGTDVPNTNIIELPAPPVASGSRQDLVILEVWRALLSPLPSSDNKSPSGSILRNGNAKAADGPPFTNVNLADDLLDPAYAAETARRVQVQYRYRVVPITNLLQYPDGLGDPTIVANTVPYYAASPVDGNPLAGYSYIASSADPGLWVAGNGDALSSTDIGSVDGYIYAVPICMIYRRNGNAFSRMGNVNGGSYILSGLSDRPDGLYCDQVVASDLIDLRKIVAYSAKEYGSDAVNSLFKNELATQFEVNSFGCGGNTSLMKDSGGISGHIGNPDNARMTFTNRPVSQTVPIYITVPLATSSVILDLTMPVDLPWLSGANILSNSPAGTELSLITKVFIDTGLAVYDANDSTGLFFVDNISYSVSGSVIDTATITFNTNIPPCVVYLETVIGYPPNVGLSRNVTSINQLWVPNTLPGWADPTYFLATSDVDRLSSSTYNLINSVNREINTAYPTSPIATNILCYATDKLMIPEMAASIALGGGYSVLSAELNAGLTIVTFNPPAVIGISIPVTYTGYRGIPEVGAAPYDTVDFFYQTRSIQSLPVPVGIYSNLFTKRTEPDRIVIVTTGSGNSIASPTDYDISSQIAIPRTPTSSYSDSEFIGWKQVETNLDAEDSGYFVVPLTNFGIPSSGDLSISTVGGTTQDAEGRNFWPLTNLKSLKTPPLVDNFIVKRKLISDFVVELKADFSPYGRKGTLFLAIATGYQYNSVSNSMQFDPSTAYDAISLFRLRGNPMYYRRSA